MDLTESTTSAAPPADELLDALAVEQARRRLVLLAVAGAIVSLMAVFLTSPMFSGPTTDRSLAVVFATLAGAFIGLGQAPVVAWAIARKRLAVAVPLVYFIAAVAAGVVLQQDQPLWCIFTFALAVPALALLARLLPDRPLAVTNHCYACGYDLSGGSLGLCPECGAPQATAAPTPIKAITS